MSIKDPEELGHWRTERDETEFRSLVADLACELWSPLPDSTTVSTSFGMVTVHHNGRGHGTPVVLLPGFGAPALMYRPELVGAMSNRTVHLVETLGDVGPSAQCAPIRDADDEAAWIVEVLDGLAIADAHIGGTSFGGWLALNLTVRAPERIRSVVGIEPVWHRIGPRTALRGIPVLAAGIAPTPVREWAAIRLHQPLLADKRLRRLGRLGFTRFRNGHPRPAFLTDDQLAGIDRPALMLLAGDSEISRADRVAVRLANVAPAITVEIVPNAGHSLPVEHPRVVGERIDRFVRAVEEPQPGEDRAC